MPNGILIPRSSIVWRSNDADQFTGTVTLFHKDVSVTVLVITYQHQEPYILFEWLISKINIKITVYYTTHQEYSLCYNQDESSVVENLKWPM